MAERGPARRSRAARALVLVERTDRQPLLRGHVGMKMISAAETVVVVRPVERAKPFPDGVELCMGDGDRGDFCGQQTDCTVGTWCRVGGDVNG
jgi:hypothetical protein